MQSSTIEQTVIMSAFELILNKNITKDMLCTMFDDTVSYLMSDKVVAMLAQYIEKETETYQKNGYVTYLSEDYVLDILTDTTERGPTFTTPPCEEFEQIASRYQGKYILVLEVDKQPTLMKIFERIGMKMAINVISTSAMALYGRVAGNYMTFLNISNKKLIDRGARIVSDLCGVTYKEALTELYYSSLLHENCKEEVSATQETIKRLGMWLWRN